MSAPGTELDFVPRCLDCGYELSGLEDGRCPECGHGFSHARLLAHHELKMAELRDRRAWLKSSAAYVLYAVALICSCSFSSSGTFTGMLIAAGFYVAMGAVGVVLLRTKIMLQPAILLILLVPLLHLASGFALLDAGRWAALLCLGLCLGVVAVAVRGSPLLAGGIVVACGAILCVWSLVVMLSAWAGLRAGHYWSDFDHPTPPRWKAMTNRQAISTGLGTLALGAAMAGVCSLYARRALVRWRRRQGGV